MEVSKFYVEYHPNCRLIKGINITFIVFILKFDRPQRLVSFRFISLVDSLYKIFLKVAANRFRKVVGKVVLESWSALV